MDRGYLDYSRLYAPHRAGAFFITRAKRDMNARRVYSAPNNREDGVRIRDDYPELIRRIRFTYPETGKTLIFLSNNMSLPATTIAALYKARWQVELFFNPVLSLSKDGSSNTCESSALWAKARTQ